jgi:hypothetical protein
MAQTYQLTQQDYENCYFNEGIPAEMPDFKNIEEVPNFKEWVYKTIEFMKYKPAHGDIIDVACMEYRNHGKYMWDAINKKLVHLDTEIDDYGHCPSKFRVGDGPGEFPPWHWHATKSYEIDLHGKRIKNYYGEIDHNNLVVLSKKLVSEISTKLVSTEDRYKCQITIAGHTYDIETIRNNHNSENDYDCMFQYEHSHRVFVQEF